MLVLGDNRYFCIQYRVHVLNIDISLPRSSDVMTIVQCQQVQVVGSA